MRWFDKAKSYSVRNSGTGRILYRKRTVVALKVAGLVDFQYLVNWLFFGLPPGMIISYVKIAWRNLRKHKGYSLINLAGLASGMAITLLIGLWISDETGFDHYHSNHARLAAVMVTQTFDGQTSTDNTVAIPLAAELQNKYAAGLAALSITLLTVSAQSIRAALMNPVKSLRTE